MISIIYLLSFRFIYNMCYVNLAMLCSGDKRSQFAYITFRDEQEAERAMLLTGATIVDMAIIITPATNYQLPAAVLADLEVGVYDHANSTFIYDFSTPFSSLGTPDTLCTPSQKVLVA